MSVTLKLDRVALRGLIDENPEVKFQLTSAVVSEVIRKVFEKDMGRLIKEADPALFKSILKELQEQRDLGHLVRHSMEKELHVSGWSARTASPALKQLLEAELTKAKAALRDSISSTFNNYVTDKAQEKVQELLAERDLDSRIAARVDRLLDAELEGRVKAHNDALRAKLKDILG